MTGNPTEAIFIGRTIAVIFSSAFFGVITFAWIKELLFYWRNGWDFEKDANYWNMYWGEIELPQDKMTNSTRIKVGYPIFFFVTLTLLLATIFFISDGK